MEASVQCIAQEDGIMPYAISGGMYQAKKVEELSVMDYAMISGAISLATIATLAGMAVHYYLLLPQ
jgi:hypothetical protein